MSRFARKVRRHPRGLLDQIARVKRERAVYQRNIEQARLALVERRKAAKP